MIFAMRTSYPGMLALGRTLLAVSRITKASMESNKVEGYSNFDCAFNFRAEGSLQAASFFLHSIWAVCA